MTCASVNGSVARGERLQNLRAAEPARERVSRLSSNPTIRLGRLRSPLAQGWDQMDAMTVGSDVSTDRLNAAVRPTSESFIVTCMGAAIDNLIAPLMALSPKLVAIEATGGFEAVVAGNRSGDRSSRGIERPLQHANVSSAQEGASPGWRAWLALTTKAFANLPAVNLSRRKRATRAYRRHAARHDRQRLGLQNPCLPRSRPAPSPSGFSAPERK